MKYILLLSLLLLAACSPAETATQPARPETLTVMTHDSFSVSEDVLTSFEEANNAEIVLLQSGDAGAALARVKGQQSEWGLGLGWERHRHLALARRCSGIPRREPMPPPRLGEHTQAVLYELLGLSAERIAELRRSGVV